MPMKPLFSKAAVLTPFAFGLLLLAGLPLAERAKAESGAAPLNTAWQKMHASRVRMIAGGANFPARGWSYVGVQLQLKKGWKTYWRSPGDTGMPPQFDWSGSQNLKKAEVLFPAPSKYESPYAASIGYKREVVLPVRIIAKDPSKPVKVRLDFGYGVCAQICISGEAKLRLLLPPRRKGVSELLAAYRKRVPQRVTKLRQKARDGFAINRVQIKLDGPKPYISVDASVPEGVKKAELFVEASDGFYLPFATQQAIDGKTGEKGARRFVVDLTKGDEAKDLAGRTLALTLVAAGDGHGSGSKGGIEYHHKVN